MESNPELTGPPPWDLSCPDWKERLRAGRSLVPDLPLDRRRADRAVAVFKKLRIPDVPGKPSMADAAAQFIFDIVAAIFGAFDQASRMRMIRGLFLLEPKKNAKTTYGAAIGMTAAILNERPMAELLITGPSQEISGKAYSQAKGMIAADPEGYLQKRFHVRDHLQTIEDRNTESKFKIKTFDASIVTGAVPSFALIDEVHLLGKDPQAEAIIQQLVGGMVSVPEAFWGMITTQSFAAPAGVFKSNLMVARGIRDGRIRDVNTLPVLYEYPEELQKDRAFWENPANWGMINPNLGKSVSIPLLVNDLNAQRHKGEEAVRIWISQHLNIEQGLGLHSERWAGADHWEKAAEIFDLDELLERSEIVCIGADGGGLDDLLGVAVIGREPETGRLLLWVRGFADRKALERRKDIAPMLLDFEQDGDLVLVDELGDDMDALEEIFARVQESGKLWKLGVDPAGVGEIVTVANRAGIDRVPAASGAAQGEGEARIVGISQGWKLSGAIKSTERALADGTLVHAGQAIMQWNVGNAKVEPRGNAITITKARAGSAKIDLLMAAFNAMSLMMMNPQPPRAPEYQVIFA